LDATEAKELGVISRIVEDDEELNKTAFEMARSVASSPTIAVKLARRIIHHLSEPTVRVSMDDELIYQTFLNRSDDFAEFKSSRTEGREPRYRGS
jgi:enoyl-CoA hydratase